jgi:hypothetical protein
MVDFLIFSFSVILLEINVAAYLCSLCLHIDIIACSSEGSWDFTQTPLQVKTLAELVSWFGLMSLLFVYFHGIVPHTLANRFQSWWLRLKQFLT